MRKRPQLRAEPEHSETILIAFPELCLQDFPLLRDERTLKDSEQADGSRACSTIGRFAIDTRLSLAFRPSLALRYPFLGTTGYVHLRCCCQCLRPGLTVCMKTRTSLWTSSHVNLYLITTNHSCSCRPTTNYSHVNHDPWQGSFVIKVTVLHVSCAYYANSEWTSRSPACPYRLFHMTPRFLAHLTCKYQR